jgi:hypothetical protein
MRANDVVGVIFGVAQESTPLRQKNKKKGKASLVYVPRIHNEY